MEHIPSGYTAITPYLCVDGAARAIEFYGTVFGATTVSRFDGPDGTVAHAELDFGAGRIQLGDPMPDHGLAAPPAGAATVTHSYCVYVPDADATYAAAVEAGATGVTAPETFVNGERYGVVVDPFGHRWALLTRVEEVDEAEANRRVTEWLETSAQ